MNYVPESPFARIQKRLQRGELIEASHEIREWRTSSPDDAGALTCDAQLLRLLGRHDEAAVALERALASAPAFAAALVEMARIALAGGRPEAALDWYERAHCAAPDATGGLDEWIELLQSFKRFDTAVRVAKALCNGNPAAPRYWFLLALAHQKAGAWPEAFEAYHRTAALDSEYPLLHSNLAALFFQTGDCRAALRLSKEAIRLAPNNHLAWTNFANTWVALLEPERALLAAERACTLAPTYGPALLARSNALKELQRWGEALAVITQAARYASGDAAVQWSVAMLQLVHGDYENGFLNHEARWEGTKELRGKSSFWTETRWRGENLAGKTLLVWGEQGFGDAIQFARFVPQIAERVSHAGGRLVYCCFAALFPLLQRSLAGCEITIVPHDTPACPAFDFQIPLGSLPLALGTTVGQLPAAHGYLKANSAKLVRWRNRLGRDAKLRVGLVWSGSRWHQRNPLRSIDPLLYAQAFGELDDIAFYSLQIDGSEEVAGMHAHGLSAIDCTPELHTFEETAALVCNLDLVVTVCTSMAHLCGALGVRTWLLLDVNPHWVWLLKRRDSPWYRSVTLYRQQRHRDWSGVLQQVSKDLAEFASRRLEPDARESAGARPDRLPQNMADGEAG